MKVNGVSVVQIATATDFGSGSAAVMAADFFKKLFDESVPKRSFTQIL